MSQNDEKSARRTIDGIRRMIYPSRRVTNRNRGRGQNNSDRSGVPFMQFMHSGKLHSFKELKIFGISVESFLEFWWTWKKILGITNSHHENIICSLEKRDDDSTHNNEISLSNSKYHWGHRENSGYDSSICVIPRQYWRTNGISVIFHHFNMMMANHFFGPKK